MISILPLIELMYSVRSMFKIRHCMWREWIKIKVYFTSEQNSFVNYFRLGKPLIILKVWKYYLVDPSPGLIDRWSDQS